MIPLRGMDSGFLALELPGQSLSSVATFALDPSRRCDLAAVRAHIEGRLDHVPALRWRVAPAPHGITHPRWVPARDFDLDAHVDEQHLAGPGGRAVMDQAVADFQAGVVDRDRPLWRARLLHDPAGDQCLLLKLHHALVDGYAGIHLIRALFGDPPYVPSGPHAQPDDRVWTTAEALRHQAATLKKLPSLVRRTFRTVRTVRAATAALDAPPPDAKATPDCSISRAFSPDRRYARVSLPLADLKAAKAAAGVTVNDVALAVLAGALRAHLLDRGELPAVPLTASVPVGGEPVGAPPRTYGNRFSALNTSLATDVADPSQRLATSSAVTRAAKELSALAGTDLPGEWLDQVPPSVLAWTTRRYDRRRRTRPLRPSASAVVSNVRGPGPLAVAGVAVEAMWISGPPNSGVGLNVSMIDYGDRLHVSILAVADALPDPAGLVDRFPVALAELLPGRLRA